MSQEIAKQLDDADSLKQMRAQFHIPTIDSREEIYFAGNSLGLMPKLAEQYLETELEKWKTLGVRGHFQSDLPWISYHENLAQPMANLVGGLPEEVVSMNSLTVNLHLMMATFYRPTTTRFKILMEDQAFPSDRYAIQSQVRWHGFDHQDAIICLTSSHGFRLLSTDQICACIEKNRNSLALVMLPGVQYYSGQVLDIEAIVSLARQYEIPVGFDLAHAVGNVPLRLHDWNVDFAVWCTYKYLNSGPGSLGGCFIHQRHVTDTAMQRLAGWWGHDKTTRFQMDGAFQPIATAEGWQLSNPSILSLAAMRAALDVFEMAGWMEPLREKSIRMNQFFRECLAATVGDRVRVVAPAEQSGCQLSLVMVQPDVFGKAVHEQLESKGIRTDWREPNVIRAAPVPLYNTFEEIWHFVEALRDCLEIE